MKNIQRRPGECMVAELTAFSVYVLRCADGSFYTGISTDVQRRLTEHGSSKKGAKYVRGRGPLTLIWSREVGSRSLASRVENRVRQLSPEEKANSDSLERTVNRILPELGHQ